MELIRNTNKQEVNKQHIANLIFCLNSDGHGATSKEFSEFWGGCE